MAISAAGRAGEYAKWRQVAFIIFFIDDRDILRGIDVKRVVGTIANCRPVVVDLDVISPISWFYILLRNIVSAGGVGYRFCLPLRTRRVILFVPAGHNDYHYDRNEQNDCEDGEDPDPGIRTLLCFSAGSSTGACPVGIGTRPLPLIDWSVCHK